MSKTGFDLYKGKLFLFSSLNLNWNSVLYLEGREPNVSYPNS